MPENVSLAVSGLKLDLRNYRTPPQKSENAAIRAMISSDPKKFWGLVDSILTDNYHPTENIVVLKKGDKSVVKEGNRRIAALKILLKKTRGKSFDLPSHIQTKLNELGKDWNDANSTVPCVVYDEHEKDAADRVVELTHAKGQAAGRSKWEAIATARYNRDERGSPEPALDLLEKFLKEGGTVSPLQAERWGGKYPLSVLRDAMPRLVARCGTKNSSELAEKYPKVKFRAKLDEVLRDIGLGDLDFKSIRNDDFAATKYGFPAHKENQEKTGASKQQAKKTTPTKEKTTARGNPKAISVKDQKSVKKILREFSPTGNNRGKLVMLLDESISLNLKNHPLAFCFLLRAMLELSAYAYQKDHSREVSLKKNSGKTRTLVELLREIHKHLTKEQSDKELLKQLHGAMMELNGGLLSITSLNQLVHSSEFAVDESHISLVFNNLFPLLREMNA